MSWWKVADAGLTVAGFLERRYGEAFERVGGQIVAFDPVELQRQTAEVTRTAASAVIDLGADVRPAARRFRSFAAKTIDVVPAA